MRLLKQSTAVSPKIGPFLDSSDGNTEETALTIAQADVLLSKNHGAFAQKNDATSCTHDTNGMYTCPLDATDTATLGNLRLYVHVSGALPVWEDFRVVSSNVYDAFRGNDSLNVHVASMGTNTIINSAIADEAISNAKFGSDIYTTEYDSNILARAARVALDELNLDHLLKTATASSDMTAEVTDGSIMSRILTKDADTSDYDSNDDSLEALGEEITERWTFQEG